MVFVPLLILAVIGVAILLRPWPLFVPREETQTSGAQTNGIHFAVEFRKWVERQARMRGLSVRGVARPVPIECPKCHKASNYFVYPDELCERCWQATLKPVSTPVNGTRL
jgi:hypothetical protein